MMMLKIEIYESILFMLYNTLCEVTFCTLIDELGPDELSKDLKEESLVREKQILF